MVEEHLPHLPVRESHRRDAVILVFGGDIAKTIIGPLDLALDRARAVLATVARRLGQPA